MTERRAQWVALASVAAAAIIAWTLGGDPATMSALFLAAIAFTAWYGGRPPAVVALLASMLAVDLFLARRAAPAGAWTIFAAAAMLAAYLIDRERRRVTELAAELAAAERRLFELGVAERDARLLNLASDRVAALAPGASAFVVTRRGFVIGWPASAGRMYGRPAAEMLGTDAQRLFGSTDPGELSRVIEAAAGGKSARWSGVHRRADGRPFDVDVELQRVEQVDAVTVAVRDLTAERQWEAYRAAAMRSDAALRDETELMRRQLAALESVTDPLLDVSRREDAEQLLERLRVAVDADGAAFAPRSRVRSQAVLANGLQPLSLVPRPQGETRGNRVLVVQNDLARVRQASVLSWPDTVSCLVSVPVAAPAPAGGVLEVVNERPRRSTDADMALIRVVASRLGSGGERYREANAVA